MASGANPTPWTQTMRLRPEIIQSGHVDDVQMSLAQAVFDTSSDASLKTSYIYADPEFYDSITHPTGQLVDLMAKVKLRLNGYGGAASSQPAVWRLDQAMGGGKSHGLIGLWHQAQHPKRFSQTDLGKEVAAKAIAIGGQEVFTANRDQPICVVMDCDNPAPSEAKDGPAKTLGERFLWRLADAAYKGAYKKWKQHKAEIVNKAKIAEVLRDVGAPVLILIDEVMDYIRWAGSQDDDRLLSGDMAFLRSLLDAVNDVDNCVLVMVMIASEDDTMALTDHIKHHQTELESLLERNGTTTTVTSGGDFGAILRRRLFAEDPPAEVVAATAQWHTSHMYSRSWRDAFSKLAKFTKQGSDTEAASKFEQSLMASYPFHPSLLELAQDHWSQHAGFQKVRSTIQVFAGAVHALSVRAEDGEWVPSLIGPGDLVLDDNTLREALLDSGLIAEQKIMSSLREICTGDICDPSNPERGTARRHDLKRHDSLKVPGWVSVNPKASERAATALLVYTISPRPQGTRGATKEELLTATFVPDSAYSYGEAEVIWQALEETNDGLAALDNKEGSGRRPKRWWLATRATLRMLHRHEQEAVSEADRDKTVTERAFELAATGPFNSIRKVERDNSQWQPNADDLCDLIDEAALDDGRKTRLVILDSRWFSNGGNKGTETYRVLRAVYGLSEEEPSTLTPLRPRHMTWGSSCVFALINTQRRARARTLARNFLAWQRCEEMDIVSSDTEMAKQARTERREAENRFEEAVKRAYQHAVYLTETHDNPSRRDIHSVTLASQTASSLDGAAVWEALSEESKVVQVDSSFDSTALLHNLGNSNWNRPLSEIRDDFWKSPRMPLLARGEKDLREAIYQAVVNGKIRILDNDGEERKVSSVIDVNLSSAYLRIAQPAAPQPPPPPPQPPQPPGGDSSGPEGPGQTSTGTSGYPPGGPGVTAPVEPTPEQRKILRGSVTTTFAEPSIRGDVYRFLMGLSPIVDGDATYINFSFEIAGPTQEISDLAESIKDTQIQSTLDDL